MGIDFGIISYVYLFTIRRRSKTYFVKMHNILLYSTQTTSKGKLTERLPITDKMFRSLPNSCTSCSMYVVDWNKELPAIFSLNLKMYILHHFSNIAAIYSLDQSSQYAHYVLKLEKIFFDVPIFWVLEKPIINKVFVFLPKIFFIFLNF